MGNFLLGIGIDGFAKWVMDQGKWAFWMILVIVMLPMAYKRAWIAAVGTALGFAFIGIFVLYPTEMQRFATWMKGLVG
ncbi:hypothetical protein [Priestia megaterium]|uniref:hypothetical protein n=1 Tax=Priestia megaterium TaxID=1404 RepID=UPI0037C81217